MIVLDIDGVVANPLDELNYHLKKRGYETRHHSEWKDYHWKNIYPDVPREVIHEIFGDPLVIKNAMAFEDAWYWTNHYSSQYDIMYLTARQQKVSSATWDWFFEWDIPADFIVFEEKKVEFLAALEVNVFVDDYPDMAQGAHDAGINAYLMNRPYNLNADVDPAIRINSLWDIKLP